MFTKNYSVFILIEPPSVTVIKAN